MCKICIQHYYAYIYIYLSHQNNIKIFCLFKHIKYIECIIDNHLVYTLETPAFGGISLVLRGSGASDAAFVAPSAARWENATFGGGKRYEMKNKIKTWGAPGAPLGAVAMK